MPNVGPVCHIPPGNSQGAQQPSDLPGIPPIAQQTLASLQNTVNQLRQIIIVLTGQQGARGPAGRNGANAPSTSAQASSFTQKSINTAKIKIFQNNDPTSGNFVEIEQVNSLVLANSNGATWTYRAAPGQNSGG
jgi:hypothetical protein